MRRRYAGSDTALYGSSEGDDQSDAALYGGTQDDEESGTDDAAASFLQTSSGADDDGDEEEEESDSSVVHAGSDTALYGSTGGDDQSDAALYGGTQDDEESDTGDGAAASFLQTSGVGDEGDDGDEEPQADNSVVQAGSDKALYGSPDGDQESDKALFGSNGDVEN